MPNPDLLTVRDVAQRLNIGIRTVWRWCATGDLPPPVRLGKAKRVVRWKAAEIERYVEQMAPPAVAERRLNGFPAALPLNRLPAR